MVQGVSHCKENPIYVFLFWVLRGLGPIFHIHVSVIDLYIPRVGTHISCSRIDRSWKYINLSQIYDCRNWETEHYNSVLEITVSFLGIHKWEPGNYIGFSSALYLQCGPCLTCVVSLMSVFYLRVHIVVYHQLQKLGSQKLAA
jgi:hypothetical protein